MISLWTFMQAGFQNTTHAWQNIMHGGLIIGKKESFQIIQMTPLHGYLKQMPVCFPVMYQAKEFASIKSILLIVSLHIWLLFFVPFSFLIYFD
jgi:hypothetical protein